jgi:hypothetical protein
MPQLRCIPESTGRDTEMDNSVTDDKLEPRNGWTVSREEVIRFKQACPASMRRYV